MNIEELIFYVTKTKTYQITVSAEEGYDMPSTPKELVEMVNNINANPHSNLSMSEHEAIDTELEVTNYEITENKTT